nr:hypothetical protein [Candidatus Njordarchaeota archaeon]
MPQKHLKEIALVALAKELPGIASSIRAENREAVSEDSIDLILRSQRNPLPQGLAWSIIRLMSYEKQTTDAGIEKLLEASMMVEPEQTINLLEKHGEREAASALRRIISTK